MFASGALLPFEVLSVKQAEVAPLSAVQQQRGEVEWVEWENVKKVFVLQLQSETQVSESSKS